MTDHPLLNPDEPESLFNYRTCGAPTKVSGKPCRLRLGWEMDTCRTHSPQEQKDRERERQAQREIFEAARAEREKVLWKEAGVPLRGDYEDIPLLSNLVTLINPRTRMFGTSPGQKRAMLTGDIPDDFPFLLVWQGQWRNDAFLLSASQLKLRLK